MNGRHVTLEQSDGYWIGRLSLGLAIAVGRKDPEYAREPLEALLKSTKPSTELRRMLREELKK